MYKCKVDYSKNLFFLSLLFSDLIAFYLALTGSFYLRKFVVPRIYPQAPFFGYSFSYFLSFWGMPIAFVFFIALEGLYTKRFSFWEDLRRIWKAIFIASIVVLSVFTLGKMGHKVSRLVLTFCFAFSFITFPLFRWLTKRFFYLFESFQEKLIILGAGRAGQAVVKGLKRDKGYDYKIIGFLDDYKTGYVEVNGDKYPIIGKIEDLSSIVLQKGIKTAVLAMPSLGSDKIKQLFTSIRKYVPNVLVVPELQGVSLLNAELDYLFYEEIFLLHTKNNLASLLNRMIKRTFDYVLGIPILILSLPFMIIVAILIKFTSHGPVLFTQWRVGQNGKPFKIYKFRTMYQDAEERLKEILERDPSAREEWEANFKLKNDPRITPIGKFLRKTSLDELPQIFNILKGEMSFVGPRPVVEEELKKYYKEDAQYYLMVKPGVTGLWQISGRSDTSYEFRRRLDVWYAQNWCLWLDIVILLQTIKVVLKMEGAY